jgi:hypothetical protein
MKGCSVRASEKGPSVLDADDATNVIAGAERVAHLHAPMIDNRNRRPLIDRGALKKQTLMRCCDRGPAIDQEQRCPAEPTGCGAGHQSQSQSRAVAEIAPQRLPGRVSRAGHHGWVPTCGSGGWDSSSGYRHSRIGAFVNLGKIGKTCANLPAFNLRGPIAEVLCRTPGRSCRERDRKPVELASPKEGVMPRLDHVPVPSGRNCGGSAKNNGAAGSPRKLPASPRRAVSDA